jgi:hypothetical protein
VNQDYLRVSGAAGRSYSIQSSTDLDSWTVVGTRATSTGIFDFTHTRPQTGNVQFYRVLQEP